MHGPRATFISTLIAVIGLVGCDTSKSPEREAGANVASPDAPKPMLMVDAPVVTPSDAPLPPAPDADAPTDKPTPDAAPPTDAPATDAAGPDAGKDAGSDTPRDATPPIDAGADAMTDAMTDATTDATASPCPGAVPPPDFDLRCGCATVGKVLCSGACSVDDTMCVPTGQFFALSNQFLGDGRVLDTFGGPPPNNATMAMPGNSGSKWVITSMGGGFYRLTNMFLMAARPLESNAAGDKLFMGNASTAAAQAWRITGAGNGFFRIRNRSFGSDRSLDTQSAAPNEPFMGKTGDFSGQYWKLTRN